MKNKKINLVSIGCSAGGIETLRQILPKLPVDFPVPVVVVQHRGADSAQILVPYFSEMCGITVREPEDKEPIVPGHVYIAPPNYHLMVETNRTFCLSVDDAVNYSRPSIDVFFETAAEVYQQEIVGIVLSGANADGAEGLTKIKQFGGVTIVQNPETAEHVQMPQAAITKAQPKYIFNVDQINEFLKDLGGSNG